MELCCSQEVKLQYGRGNNYSIVSALKYLLFQIVPKLSKLKESETVQYSSVFNSSYYCTAHLIQLWSPTL